MDFEERGPLGKHSFVGRALTLHHFKDRSWLYG